MAGQGIFTKIKSAADTWLDSYISRTRSNVELELSKAKSGMEDEKYYRRSLYLPPAYQFSGAGFKEKTTRVGFQTLRLMSYRDSIIASILQTRMNQVAVFSRPQKDRYSQGFVVEFKDRDKKLSKEECETLTTMQEFIANCGILKDKPKSQRMTFEAFLRRIVRDRLTFDQIAIEKIFDQKGDMHHFVPVDSSTIRFASSKVKSNQYLAGQENVGILGENKIDLDDTEGEKEPDLAAYVQVVEGQVKRQFTADELIFRFGNPVNDIYANGYSVGELELLIGIVTSHLHAENYNKMFFTQGHVTKGLLHLEANIPQNKLEAFKQQWYAQTSGNANSWRTPIIAGVDKVNWVPLTQSNRDMEFNSWLSYLIKIACAIYQISPSEIGFDISKGTGENTGSSLFESNNESRLKHSQDKGLKPLLVLIEDIINEEIIDKINNELVFRFVGYDAENKEQEVERLIKEVAKYKMVDEVRAEIGLKEIGKELGGHMILDPNYLQWISQFGKFESEKSQEMQQQFGFGDEQGFDDQEKKPDDEEQNVDEDMKGPKDEKAKKSLVKSKKVFPKLLRVEYYRK